MQKDRIILVEFCKEIINWVKGIAIMTHNECIISNQDSYKSGMAFSCYEVYSLLQMQAEVFLIPLPVLGLKDIREKDLLSISLITPGKKVSNIADKYSETIIDWMGDNIYIIKENAISTKENATRLVLSTEIDNSTKSEELDYYKGKLFSYFSIIEFMRETATKLGIPLEQIKLNDIDPKKDLVI